jgi:IS30 family transposase
LRQRPKYRKRYGTYEKRGRLGGKRHISERPSGVELRQELGHWEMDTVSGTGSKHCIVTLVERASGCLLIGKLADHTKAELNRRVTRMILERPDLSKTITVDNGTEFHGYQEIERATGVTIYFATPYHAWERGTNENTNGLIRQYLPKRHPMKDVSQAQCSEIACILNNRPRKRYGFFTPLERLKQLVTPSRQ